MEFEIGSIVSGKVTGITKFGAFVTLAPGTSGLVHISEIANSYVSDVSAFLQTGQEVKVKIISVDDAGRMNLSIKQAEPPKEPAPQPRQRFQQPHPQQHPTQPRPAAPEPTPESAFEDKLKRFMQDSDSRMSDLKHHTDKRSSRRKR